MIPTEFAPAKRAFEEELLTSFNSITNSEYVDSIINALPYIAVILNKYRQVIFANNELLSMLGFDTFDSLLGLRPGELLHCKNASNNTGGCGTSENCTVCGAVHVILQSLETHMKAEGECRISAQKEGETISYEFKVKTTPIDIKGEQFLIFSMIDISDEKRKNILERIFYHDILNRAGNIKSISQIFEGMAIDDKKKELATVLNSASKEMLNEIRAQRQLNLAENNELKVNFLPVNSLKMISDVTTQIAYHEVAAGKSVVIDKASTDSVVQTDQLLLKRILLNMLKNALEASPNNSTITIGCYSENKETCFWVHNPTFIPRNIQLQIFMRSFSTKGDNRGLGTYSMKLLGEKYLKGKVNFTTDVSDGTKFSICINES